MDELIFVDRYYDGPLSGITSIKGEKFFFLFPFSEAEDDYSKTANLYLIDGLINFGHFSEIKNATKSIDFLDCETVKSLLDAILENNTKSISAKSKFERIKPGITASCFTVYWTLVTG